MFDISLCQNAFLRKLDRFQSTGLSKLLARWDVSEQRFPEILDRWFSNFEPCDQPLAFRILMEIDYYSEARLHSEFKQRIKRLEQMNIRLSGPDANAFAVVPEEIGDSATLHGNLLAKLIGIDEKHFKRINNLGSIELDNRYLVFFNDTYGSGNQFNKQSWPILKSIIL